MFDGKPLQVIVDDREMRGGEKAWAWIKKGVPIRIEVGPRDIENNAFPLKRRDLPHKQSVQLSRGHLVAKIGEILEEMQGNLYEKALAFRKRYTRKIDRKEEFYEFFTPKNSERPEIHGGFADSHWCGDRSVEEQIKTDLGVTIRCIPLEASAEEGACVITGKKSKLRVIYAKSY
jgi:prolyl-tRNA synthetase